MSAANRTRGANAERAVVNYLRDNGWPDARRYLAGDGRQPGDIDWHPIVCLEVKDRAESSWPSWCRQATAEARFGMFPVVVRRTRGVPRVGEWPCRLPMADAMNLGLVCAHAGVVDGEVWIETAFSAFVGAMKRLQP